jgi:hypothetical protein
MTKSKTFGLLGSAVLAVAALSSTVSAKPAPGPDRAAIRAKLAAHRAAEMERLAAYEAAGQFPHDLIVAPSLHMFRDAAGRYCAVANLVHLDGHDDIVANVVKTQNDLAIADVKNGPLYDWILESGFTQAELAFIQKPAPQVQAPRPHLAPEVAVDDLVGGETEKQMNAEMVAHLDAVKAKLAAQTDASLDAAVDSYIAAHKL